MSKKDPEAVEAVLSLGPEKIAALPDDEIGDGKAEFFAEPTASDELEFQREEQGLNKWYKRIAR